MIEVANGFHRKSRLLSFRGFGLSRFFLANLFQLTGVEPITAAVWAMIHLNLLLCAEKVALELHVIAARAIALARLIYNDHRVVLNPQKIFRRDFALFIHTLKFKRVEPDAAATAGASIHGYAAEFEFRQIAGTGRAFHFRQCLWLSP
jgi:hypothetical protein